MRWTHRDGGISRVAFLATLPLLLLSCGGNGDNGNAADTTTREPRTTVPTGRSERPTSSTVSSSEAAVLDAYLGYWRAYQRANDPPDQFHPDLRRYATGDVYNAVFSTTQANRLSRRALRPRGDAGSQHRAEVVSVTGDEAVVRDCSVDDLLVVDIDSGQVLDDRVVTRLGTATLRLEDGLWKVAATTVQETWPGVGGCALR